MKIIFGNYGNDTLALIQFFIEQQTTDIQIIHIDTGFADDCWHDHIAEQQKFAISHGFQVLTLKSTTTFEALIIARGDFPTAKFPWCAKILKGKTLLKWLDETDPDKQATIILPKRRDQQTIFYDLTEWELKNIHYGNRLVWQPLYQHTEQDCMDLLRRANRSPLPHPAHECLPCVRQTPQSYAEISPAAITRTENLEAKIGKTFFEKPITTLTQNLQTEKNQPGETRFFYCGSPYVCGL